MDAVNEGEIWMSTDAFVYVDGSGKSSASVTDPRLVNIPDVPPVSDTV